MVQSKPAALHATHILERLAAIICVILGLDHWQWSVLEWCICTRCLTLREYFQSFFSLGRANLGLKGNRELSGTPSGG